MYTTASLKLTTNNGNNPVHTYMVTLYLLSLETRKRTTTYHTYLYNQRIVINTYFDHKSFAIAIERLYIKDYNFNIGLYAYIDQMVFECV